MAGGGGSIVLSLKESNQDLINGTIGQVQQGHLNCTVVATLTANATSTVVVASTCTINSGIYACPLTADATAQIIGLPPASIDAVPVRSSLSGSGTYNSTTGTQWIRVQMTGGGGGGGGSGACSNGQVSGGGGGGGGGYAERLLSPGSYSYSVGAGGAGGTGAASGSNGGNTTFGGLTATGGGGAATGGPVTMDNDFLAGGGGGGNGDVNGDPGGPCYSFLGNSIVQSGYGGGNPLAPTTASVAENFEAGANGNDGQIGGAGGSGGANIGLGGGTGAANGGTGGAGTIIIEEHYESTGSGAGMWFVPASGQFTVHHYSLNLSDQTFIFVILG